MKLNATQNKIQTIFLYMMVGIAFGAIAITVALVINVGMTDVTKQIIVWLTAAAILGLFSTVYELDGFTHLTATLIHAPVTCIIALVCGWILNYGDGSFSLLLLRMLPSIVVIYVMIHLILFLFRRATLKTINNHLKK
ncbi:MAG: DUF3021 family protein [Eubacteriales bacterium]|nr:DUF3021 family protein [Eubacteriales bacterium]